MAKVLTDGNELVVRLRAIEKLAAFHGDVRVPLAAVIRAEAEPHPWAAVRGVRAPGTGITGMLSYGVRRYPEGADFAAILFRRRAVRIDLDGSSPFSRLVVSVGDAESTAAEIRAAARDAQKPRS